MLILKLWEIFHTLNSRFFTIRETRKSFKETERGQTIFTLLVPNKLKNKGKEYNAGSCLQLSNFFVQDLKAIIAFINEFT